MEKMMDLINRQAVLDGKMVAVISGQVVDVVQVSYIKNLPSVQPVKDINVHSNDCISRQEVIRLILERGLYCDTQEDREVSADIIRQLPSAQPEKVKCKKCRYVYYDKEFGNYWCNRKPDSFMVEEDGYCKWGK